MLPWHGSVQFVQVGGQAVLQNVVDDQLRFIVVLLQTGQQEAVAQIRQQVLDTGQQRIQLRTAYWTRSTLIVRTDTENSLFKAGSIFPHFYRDL